MIRVEDDSLITICDYYSGPLLAKLPQGADIYHSHLVVYIVLMVQAHLCNIISTN